MLRNPAIKLAFRSFFAIGTLAGIIANIIFHDDVLRALSYYTVQSNVFVLLLTLMLLVYPKLSKFHVKRLKLVMASGILITFLVYHIVLYPSVVATGDFVFPFWYDFPVHTFTPLMMLLDYFLFDRESKLSAKSSMFGLIMPAFYLLYIQGYALFGGNFIIGENVSRYPYFFLDPEAVGSGWVIISLILISLLAVFIGWVLVIIDKKVRFKSAEVAK